MAGPGNISINLGPGWLGQVISNGMRWVGGWGGESEKCLAIESRADNLGHQPKVYISTGWKNHREPFRRLSIICAAFIWCCYTDLQTWHARTS